jgi:hypothetical protein
VFVEGVTSPYSLMAASKGVYGESAGEWTPADALGYSKMLALTGVFYKRAGEERGPPMSGMRTVVVDKIASVTQACGLSHEIRIAGHSLRGRRGAGGRDPQQQVHLQHRGADQRPHGESGARRHRGRRAGPSQGAVRLLGPHSRDAQAGRCDSNAEHRRRAGHLRFGHSGQGQALRLQGVGRGADLPLSRASASACRPRSGYKALDYDAALDVRGVPVVALAGTCMEAGKTAAASAIIAACAIAA